jgi:hypothetical protein
MCEFMQIRHQRQTAPQDDDVHRWDETALTAARRVVVPEYQSRPRRKAIRLTKLLMQIAEFSMS